MVTSEDRNEPPDPSARSAAAMRSRTAATNQIKDSNARPVSTQPMLMWLRLLELPYQAAIFAGEESCGPSYRKMAPTTARTAKAMPPRFDHARRRATTDPSSSRHNGYR